MLTRLLEIFNIDNIAPFFRLDYHQGAVLVRAGRIYRVVMSPGYYFKLPYYDHVDYYDTTVSTYTPPRQDVETSFGAVSFSVVIRAIIYDVRKYATTVLTEEGFIADVFSVAAANIVSEWDGESNQELALKIQDALEDPAEEYGVIIEEVGFNNLVSVKALRVIGDHHFE